MHGDQAREGSHAAAIICRLPKAIGVLAHNLRVAVDAMEVGVGRGGIVRARAIRGPRLCREIACRTVLSEVKSGA
jgi:hypothetical protein